jgi:hypothetical protein
MAGGGVIQGSISLAAAILFTALFGLATLLHSYQLFLTRSWFLIPFLVGGVCMFI